jgi:hypothetical protein
MLDRRVTLTDPALPTRFFLQGCFNLITTITTNQLLFSLSMFGRFNQLARHLTRPLPNLAQTPAGLAASMTSSAKFFENKTKTIHTAACLIIGDEVLGGKVRKHTRFVQNIS